MRTSKPGTKVRQIRDHLFQGIRSRQFKRSLPSENRLARKFNVSRMTARKALNELEREGYVDRIQGKGTYIREQGFSQGYFRVQPSWKQAQDLNMTLKTEVLELCAIPEPPEDIAKKMNYHQQTILARRLHFFNHIPVRYETRYLRGDVCGGILWENLEKISIHELLIKKYRLPLTAVWQRMTAVAMPAPIAGLFQETPGFPAFRIQRLTFTNDEAVTFVEYFIRGELAFEDTLSLRGEDSSRILKLAY